MSIFTLIIAISVGCGGSDSKTSQLPPLDSDAALGEIDASPPAEIAPDMK
jgi:hypothetical protein